MSYDPRERSRCRCGKWLSRWDTLCPTCSWKDEAKKIKFKMYQEMIMGPFPKPIFPLTGVI